MPKKISVLLLSLIVAFGFMSGGYGYWQKTLVIDGNGIVVKEAKKELLTLTKTFSGNDEQVSAETNEENVINEMDLSGGYSENAGNGVEGSFEGNGENLGASENNSGQGTDSDNEGNSNENGNNQSGNNESNYSDSGSSVSDNSDSGTSDSGGGDTGGGDSDGSDSGSGDSGSDASAGE